MQITNETETMVNVESYIHSPETGLNDLVLSITTELKETRPDLLDFTLFRITITSGLPHSDYGQTVEMKFKKATLSSERKSLFDGQIVVGN